VSALLGVCRRRRVPCRRSPLRWVSFRSESLDEQGSITSVQAYTCRPTTTPTRPFRPSSPTLARRCAWNARLSRSVSIPPSTRSGRRAALSALHRRQEHYDTAQGVKKTMQRYKDLQEIIAILGMRSYRRRQAGGVARAQDPALLSQPFYVAPRFTGREGKSVPVKETVRGFKGDLEGKHDDCREQAFYMVGTIDDAARKPTR